MDSCCVATYRRISTDPRLQQWSLAAQTEALQDVARLRGWTVVADFKDEESGSHISRPGLQALLDAMAEGKIKRVLVVDQDRISRLDPIEWELVKRSFRESGCQLVTPSGDVDFDDEDQELVSDVWNLFARHQRRKIKKATMRGRAEAFRNGRWLTKAPFGYRRSSGRLVPDTALAPIVRSIFERYAAGESASGIATDMERRGVVRPQGGHWDTRRVSTILRNPAYKGWTVCQFPAERIEAPDTHPAIVPAGLWARCNEVADRRKNESRFYLCHDEDTLLSGILYCTDCSHLLAHRRMSTKRPNGKRYEYVYYRHRNGVRWRAPTCPTAHRAERVDGRVLDAITALGTSASAARAFLFAANDQAEGNRLQAAINEIAASQGALEQRRKRLIDLYLDGGCTKEDYEARKISIDKQKAAQDRERVDLHQRAAAIQGLPADSEQIVGFYSTLGDVAHMSQERQRLIVQALFTRAEIDRGGLLRLYARLPAVL